MAMLDSMISGLTETPAVKEAMVKLEELRNGVIQAMTHFNGRFDAIDSKLDHLMSLTALVNNKLDKIIFSLDHPSDIRPASDDGLLKMLLEDGQEMRIQEVEPLQVLHESEV